MNHSNAPIGESGAAIVECALTLALVLLVGFSCLEFSKALRSMEFATLLSREAASVAYRDCGADSGSKLSECLELTRMRMEQFGNSVSGENVELILSHFAVDESGTIVRTLTTTAGSAQSRFDETASDPALRAVIQSQNTVVVAESYFPYRSLLGTSQQRFWLGSDHFYVATFI